MCMLPKWALSHTHMNVTYSCAHIHMCRIHVLVHIFIYVSFHICLICICAHMTYYSWRTRNFMWHIHVNMFRCVVYEYMYIWPQIWICAQFQCCKRRDFLHLYETCIYTMGGEVIYCFYLKKRCSKWPWGGAWRLGLVRWYAHTHTTHPHTHFTLSIHACARTHLHNESHAYLQRKGACAYTPYMHHIVFIYAYVHVCSRVEWVELVVWQAWGGAWER